MVFVALFVALPMEFFFWPHAWTDEAALVRQLLGTCLAVILYSPVFVAAYYGAGNSEADRSREKE